ncbi:MAG: NADAR family protein [Patescibacteria group bacterium]
MYPDSSEGLNKETDDAIYFFTPAFHILDSFSAHTVKLWGKTFPTAEHAFQWKKFSVVAPDVAEKILQAGSPEAAKRIAIAHKSKVLPEWYGQRASVMREVLAAKAEQHDDVREQLKKTGNRIIVENSPVDNFWGCGPDGKGENMIGKIWMEIRKKYC